MNVIAIDSGNSSLVRERVEVNRLEEVADELPIIPLKVPDVERSVEWPEVAFDVEHFSQSAIATRYNSWPFDLGFTMTA